MAERVPDGRPRRRTRPGLSVPVLVATARDLLVQGGTDAVVIREVARSLSVAPSALYKHVAGRDELLTMLVAALYDELADACEAARVGQPAEHHWARLRVATDALRSWAAAHPAEFDLLFGYPIAGYAAPEGGPTTAAARRFGAVFFQIYGDAMRDGRLRVRSVESMPDGLRTQLARNPLARDIDMPPEAFYQLAMGFQRMLGLVMVEISGQLGWALEDPSLLTGDQIDRLGEELMVPGP